MRFFFFRPSYLILAVLLAVLLVGCGSSRKKRSAVQLRSEKVQEALADIADALQNYYGSHGYFPKGMATLRDAGYLSIMPDVEREWRLKFYTDGGEIQMVEAMSLSGMPDGDGWTITYRVQANRWEGYGITAFP